MGREFTAEELAEGYLDYGVDLKAREIILKYTWPEDVEIPDGALEFTDKVYEMATKRYGFQQIG